MTEQKITKTYRQQPVSSCLLTDDRHQEMMGFLNKMAVAYDQPIPKCIQELILRRSPKIDAEIKERTARQT